MFSYNCQRLYVIIKERNGGLDMESIQLSTHSYLETCLESHGYQTPTPIQASVMPLIRERRNILFLSPTGSGKTLTYVIPILESIDLKIEHTQALIIVPTRELAIQVRETVRSLEPATGVKCSVLFGGSNPKSQKEILKKHVPILVITAGKASELIKAKKLKLEYLSYLVLDEADLLTEKNCYRDSENIVAALSSNTQVILCSATKTPKLETFAKNLQLKIIETEEKKNENIEQSFYQVEEKEKYDRLKQLLEKEQVFHALIFVQTKNKATKLAQKLTNDHIPAIAFHHDLEKEKRKKIAQMISQNQPLLLVTTDIAARGLDIPNLPYVIQYDAANSTETYFHRIGRTGRKNKGNSIIFLTKQDDKLKRDIEYKYQTKIKKKKKIDNEKVIKKKKKRKHTKNIGKPRKKK